jgi:transposase InsO family protein
MSDLKPFLFESMDSSLVRVNWEKWIRSFEIYSDANDISDNTKKRAKFLHLGGTDIQELVYNLPGAIEEYDPARKNDVYTSLIEKLNDHFSPIQNSTFERHLFRSLQQKENEKISDFVIRLRNQANKCNFGSTQKETIEINLKDKIIDSCTFVELKKKFLEKEYSFKEITDMYMVHEQIQKQSKMMMGNGSEVNDNVNKINTFNRKYSNIDCGRCGSRNHTSNDQKCPAINKICTKCNLRGHFSLKCRTNKRRIYNNNDGKFKKRKLNVNAITSEDESFDDLYHCFRIDNGPQHKLSNEELISCKIGNSEICMLIDSGSKLNIINGKDWKKISAENPNTLSINKDVGKVFKAYASPGNLQVSCKFNTRLSLKNGNSEITTFYVVENGDKSLLGKNSAINLGVLRIGLDINNIVDVTPFPKMRNIIIQLKIDPNVTPVTQPYRRVPIALEEKIEKKLNEALKMDIIELVDSSPWISPIVVVLKDDKDIRICVDMRRANLAIKRENYPMPTFEDLVHKLRNSRLFSRLDVKNAFHQLELSPESRSITTFITHRGLYQYKRLMFGINAAPEIFQKVFERMLSNCSGCINYIDDIVVFGETSEIHNRNLQKVLQTLKNNDVLLNEKKCIYGVEFLEFLGHNLSVNGIRPSEKKIEAIKTFREPKTNEEVRSFLGLVTYVGKFLPNLTNETSALRILMKNGNKFEWGKDQVQAFQNIKNLLANVETLGYFDPKKRTRLIADASPIALGAVLLQFKNDNSPIVISYASKSLTETEQRYSQTEKEALGLVWSVERFYMYLCGIEFELETDHKPLEAIFKATSRPCPRIARWVLRLQSFKFKVVYRSGKANIADSLSRLSQPTETLCFDKEYELFVNTIIENAIPCAISIKEIISKSQDDSEIDDVILALKSGNFNNPAIKQFKPFQIELCEHANILLRGTKIVIPKSLRIQVLQLSHEGHPGETLMKRRLRTKVWWPLIDRDVEEFVKKCKSCLLVARPSPPNPMKRRIMPLGPWDDIAIDFLGPLPSNDYLLVVVDYYSRYFEIEVMRMITSGTTINRLERMFSRLGIPKTITLDNGRQLTSNEFKEFAKQNNIELFYTPPYWPEANGLVERQNESILKRLKISKIEKTDWKKDLSKYLLMYNTTPHSTTGKTPTELLLGRTIRGKIPGISDNHSKRDLEAADNDIIRKSKGKESEDKKRNAKNDDIEIGDTVVLKNSFKTNKLTPEYDPNEYTVISRRHTEITVKGKEGKEYKRNVNHLKKILPNNKNARLSLSNQNLEPDVTTSETIGNSEPRVTPLKLKRKEGMWQTDSTVEL